METPLLSKELTILAHIQEITRLIGNDHALAASVSQKLDTLKDGQELRKILVVRRQEQPYYNEKTATALRPLLDTIIETDKPVDILLAANPRLSLRTLYLRIYQGWLYLIDNDPSKEKYATLRARCEIQQRRNFGVRINPRISSELVGVVGEVVTDPEDINGLQNRISKFLEKDLTVDELFEDKAVMLTEEQIAVIEQSLAGLPKMRYSITSNLVKILRYA